MNGSVPKGRWVKGQSGNPSGRRKADKTLTELARDASPEAIRTLIKIMRDPKAPHGARAVAADRVLDRAWGKAPQLVGVVTDMRRAVELTDDELAAIVAGQALPPPAEETELVLEPETDPTLN